MNMRAFLEQPSDAIGWTPERVQLRYTEALRIVGRLPQMRAGSGGGGWPSLLMDMAKAYDEHARRTINGPALDEMGIARDTEIDMTGPRRPALPLAEQISRAEEAIGWPLRYLRGFTRGADALSIYCYGRAFRSFEVQPFLQERMRQAQELAKREADYINNKHPDHAKARQRRRELATEVNEILNGWLASAQTAEEAIVMKREALVLLRSWCAEAGVLPVQPRSPYQVCPDLVLARWALDRARKRAAAIIARGLIRDGVVVR